MIIDNKTGEIMTHKIISCTYNPQTQRYDIKFKSGKTFAYGYDRITKLKDPISINPNLYHISHLDYDFSNIKTIYVFSSGHKRYWHICFGNGDERSYPEDELCIVRSCLDEASSKNVFNYLEQVASLVSLKTEDGTEILSKQYEKISSFLGEDTALSCYLNPEKYQNKFKSVTTPIFPFGCNASQYKAVKNALENKISIIQGPPGTGKTQTILNIIANLLVQGKTVQVVSNNNSATANVLEKLSKYGMDFMVASLGRKDNKTEFVKKQNSQYPDISNWKTEIPNENLFLNNLYSISQKLNEVFSVQENLSLTKQELNALNLEFKHYKNYLSETGDDSANYKIRRNLKSSKVMQLWQECQMFSENNKKLTFLFKIKSFLFYGIADWNIYRTDISKVIHMFQSLFYQTKGMELSSRIDNFDETLSMQNAEELMNNLCSMSMVYLKNKMHSKYNGGGCRRVFSDDDLWKDWKSFLKEYPVVLSTTYSSRSSLCTDAQFDYLIMDEASQIDVATGALALSSAKNVVIVGDTKQLPNVVPEYIERNSNAIFESFNISESYRFANKSFLQSVCEVIPTAPQTLLREHYRCHPKIINFCNQKFYGGELIIMTADNGETDVLSVMKTVEGNHQRDHMNKRQIDSIKNEILPRIEYSPEDIGIISPYNDQVDALIKEFNDNAIDISTVHKFQGREKEAIILTTVDNEITDFTDDPYLLNVAISRARRKLNLVVSGNAQPTDTNIYDLISYIEYNNFNVEESKIYSVFDYLYSQYTESRKEFLKRYKKISSVDSENLMYALIVDTIKELALTSYGVVCHQPLNMLIRDPSLLNDEECAYAMNENTHLDFLVYNRVSKKPVLAVEVDGYAFHKSGTVQHARDKKKNRILELYGIPLLRFATNGSGEKEMLVKKLRELSGF